MFGREMVALTVICSVHFTTECNSGVPSVMMPHASYE